MKKINIFVILFIALFFSAHYFWLIIWEEKEGMLLIGGDLFSIIASLIAAFPASTFYQ